MFIVDSQERIGLLREGQQRLYKQYGQSKSENAAFVSPYYPTTSHNPLNRGQECLPGCKTGLASSI